MAFVCQSLQYLISALTQADEGGPLFRFACSVVLWGGRALQTNVTGMCGECSQCSGPTGFAPTRCVCAFPSILLRLQVDLQGAGPELHALPRPKPLRFQFSGTPQNHRLGWACILCLPCLSSSDSQELDERLIPSMVPALVSARAGSVHLVSVLGSWSLAATLPADVDHPESQEVFG